MERLRFRQVHLDFHTSPHIPGIGEAFDKQHWQETLRKARVDSVTCFSSCHHGWSYHPTEVGKMHPHLKINLLREQMDACKEIDVNVPVYMTAGVNDVAAYEHPEWHEIADGGVYQGWNTTPLTPGFHTMCFNTPYLDYLCDMIRETVTMFPEADGIFLDIIHQGPCCCRWCMDGMQADGFDPENEADRAAFAHKVLMNYYQRSTAAVRSQDPSMRVFHNSGHIQCGNTDILKYFSHLELESLPTGGWGYDHYPVSAAYCRKLDLDFLGMTGKFHTTWGEFGGLKHPNALRYECAAMLAYGSKCSIGDQLHPCGKFDDSTYEAIGAAYREVEQKEPWCIDAVSAANVAILSSTAVNHRSGRGDDESAGEIGAARMLLESQIHFDLLDDTMDANAYKVLLLADDIRVDAALKKTLDTFLANGGKLILSGESGLERDDAGFAVPVGADHAGISPYQPDYILPGPDFRPAFLSTPYVMYLPSQRIRATTGRSLGQVHDPYFNRSYKHYCSHQHAPFKPEVAGFDCGVMTDNILYFAHPVFSIYRGYGAVVVKMYVMSAIETFIGPDLQLATNLPSQARVSLMHQPEHKRFILHLLYVSTICRGGPLSLSGGTVRASYALEVIEELNPLNDITVTVHVPETITRVTLEPQGIDAAFAADDGGVSISVESLTCHQVVALHY